MRNLKSIFAVLLVLSILILTFQNCAPMESQKMLSNGSLGTGDTFDINDYPEAKVIEGFQTTLQPILTSTCLACHQSIQMPFFAQSDAASAYDLIKEYNLVNFANPQSSKFVAKIMAGHNGFPTTIAQDIQGAVTDWREFLIESAQPTPTPTPSPSASPTPSPTPGGDTTMPTVSFTAPAVDATVSGAAVTVSANASDNVAVVGVRFKLDGVNLGSEDTTSPYSITWDASTATSGSHTLSAVARDAAGNMKTVTRMVTVSSGSGNPNAKYSWLATNVFTAKCTSCHKGANPPAGVNLNSYNGVKARVIVGDAANSILYEAVTRTNKRMPKDQAALPTAQLNAIRDWINDGAPNN